MSLTSIKKNEPLVTSSNIVAWNTLLNANRIRQQNKILNLVGSEQENGYPVVKHHKSCWAMFTFKRNLDQLTKDPLDSKDKRSSFREKGGSTGKRDKDVLPAKCIFCRKEKYAKNSRTREKLNSCTQFCADDKVRKASLLNDDAQILAICTSELTVKEAMHYASCYKSYTLILYKHENPVAENDTIFDKSSNVLKVVLQNLVRNKDFTEYVKVTENIKRFY